jgi:hypothetical protein
MNTTAHDFVTVDMRGLKAALLLRARADRVSVSALVRRAVAGNLGLSDLPTLPTSAASPDMACSPTTVKLSIRLTSAETDSLAAGARAAGLACGAYLAGLVADIPVLSAGAGRNEHLAALVASSAELSTLSRNIQHLTSLLRLGEVRAAREYREMLDTLTEDVLRHLVLASKVLAELRPRGRSEALPARPFKRLR